MKKLLFAVALLATFLSSCGDDKVVLNPDKVGTTYYPLQIGTYKIYNIKEKTYLNNSADSITYQVREAFNEVFKDQTGREWYRVEVSRRETNDEAWRITGVKTVSRDPLNNSSGSLLVKENNRTVVEMVYPVVEDKAWNPNAFNTGYYPNPDDESLREEFIYKKVGQPFTFKGQSFDNTVTIVKADYGDLISETRSFEVLALNQGPVHRYYKQLNFCNSDSDDCDYFSDEIYIVNGVVITETIVSAGKID